MPIFKHIGRKLIFYFLTVTILLLGIVTFLCLYRCTDNTKRQTFEHLRLTAMAIKGHIYTFINAQKDIARDFASDMKMSQSLKELRLPDVDPAAIIKELGRHVTINKMPLHSPQILDISVLDHTGRVVFSIDETRKGMDESDKGYFSEVKGEGYFGDLYYSERFYEPVIEVSAPIIDRETGAFYGVIVNTISGSALANITHNRWLEEYGSITKTSSFGAYFYGQASEGRGRKAIELSEPGKTEDVYIVNSDKKMITESRSVADAVLNQVVDTRPVQIALTDGEEMVGIYPDYRGVPIIGASIFIKELGWVILAERDINETFASLFRLKAQLITIGIVALGIVIAISFLVAGGITLPIKRLIEATRRRSEGDLDYRAEAGYDDELGVLTASYNKMCDEVEKITVSKDYMEKVFSGISESLIIIDRHCNIKRINTATSNILGYSEAELVDRPISVLFEGNPPPFITGSIGLRELIWYDHVINNQDMVYKTKDGDCVPINLSASIIRDCKHKKHPEDCPNYKKKSICGNCENIDIIVVARDMRMWQQFLHTEKLSSIGEMVSGIAHEINNPLAGIMGLSQLLQLQPDLPPAVRKNIDKIFSYTDRTKRIIQNLLTFARTHKVEKAPVDINQVIEQTLEMREYDMRLNNIEIVKEMNLALPNVIADAYQLQQVFFNIINNAYQAICEHDTERALTIRTEKKADNLVISIHNTGPGISKDIIKRMFDPFFTTKPAGRGTGMGLSVSYGIVKEHGGDIYATSETGKGVTLYVELPLGNDAAAAAPFSMDSLRSDAKGSDVRVVEAGKTFRAGEGLPTPMKMNILVVDDEIEVAHSISSLLEVEGHRCDVAMDGGEAIERLMTTTTYDMIISDIKMPRVDGKALFSYLKLNNPRLAVKFIAITGDVASPDTKSFIEENRIACIAKPFAFDELKKVMAEIQVK